MYDYAVTGVGKVTDGDTVRLYLDVGFRTTVHQRIRLAVINAPERGRPGYDTAKLFLADWLRERPGHLRVTTYTEDNFGRWVAHIYDKRNGDTASAALLQAGLATVWA